MICSFVIPWQFYNNNDQKSINFEICAEKVANICYYLIDMSVISAHGANPQEINKYDNIDSLSYFSVAQYYSANHKEPMLAFEHAHEEYTFVIPLKTIHLWKHDTFKAIGEVGFCYPADSGIVHGVDHDLNKSDFISIVIAKEYLLERAAALGYKNPSFGNKFPISRELSQIVRNFQVACRSEFPSPVELDMLAKEITDWLITNGLAVGKRRFIPERTYDSNIRRVLSYMFMNYYNPDLSLTELANYCGYSVAYFSRVFKKYVGDSPITHLNKLRVSEARSLFSNDKLSLSDIATIVGFNNLSTFTESFKTITGMRPKAFRKQLYNIERD